MLVSRFSQVACLLALTVFAGCESVERQPSVHEVHDPVTGETSHKVTASFHTTEVQVTSVPLENESAKENRVSYSKPEEEGFVLKMITGKSDQVESMRVQVRDSKMQMDLAYRDGTRSMIRSDERGSTGCYFDETGKCTVDRMARESAGHEQVRTILATQEVSTGN